ncbi:MAG: hypothetical protein G01um101419_373 [Parcubacteria group bacterium Gr01-1014_19]|nr:MAG: hypothetical protein G01um101419_373 [Parcubacteria group bacterium Gr01-1014_19]
MAPSQILEKVRVELHARERHEVRALLAHGKPLDDFSVESIQAMVLTSNLVLAGMSSSEKLSKEEIVAVQTAMDNDIPYGFVNDIFDCYKRPWFAPFREKASKLFVVAPDEIPEAKTLFPNADVVASGNPCWEDYFDPTMPKSEVRKLLGIPDEHKVVLCVGGKDPIGNMIYGDTIRAMTEIAGTFDPAYTVVLAPHPGDPVKPENYECFAEFSKFPVVKIAKPGVIPTRDLIAASDVLVVLASNLGIEAACQRKPVIHYFHELYENKVRNSGGWPWKPIDMRIAAGAGRISWLAEEIEFFLDQYADSQMRHRQEEVFPTVTEKGVAARKICDALESDVVKK